VSGHDPRLPGDTAPGDRDFGPLGGLPDQVHHFTRSRERTADTAGERLLRDASSERPGWRRRLETTLAGLRHRVGRARSGDAGDGPGPQT
jgi:hypothetical protein